MKALTLSQPWASLVALGHKRVETRTWKTNYTGALVIHAAKSYLPEDLEWAQTPGIRKLLDPLDPADLPLGVGLCVVTLLGCIQTERVDKLVESGFPEFGPIEYTLGNFEPKRWAWMLEFDGLFIPPVMCKGALGLWDWPQADLNFAPAVKPQQETFSFDEDPMPLIKSKSRKAIGKNIKEMEAAGHSPAQSKAAALNTARKAGAKIPKKKARTGSR